MTTASALPTGPAAAPVEEDPRGRHTKVGQCIVDRTGVTGGLEVSDEVFRPPAGIAFDPAENRRHTIKAVMAATIGG
jgi:ornithine carbamoyltransferase